MQETLKKMLVKLLKEVTEKVETGNCEMSESEAMDLMGVLSHQAMSKDEACSYLNIGRSKFDGLVKDGQLPRGRKRRGFKELRWYRDELDRATNKI